MSTDYCTCKIRPGDEYYCRQHGHGGDGSWIDLKVKSTMLIEKLGDWIVEQEQNIKDTAATSFGVELKELGQTLYKLTKQDKETKEDGHKALPRTSSPDTNQQTGL